jgi:hypothetical protein
MVVAGLFIVTLLLAIPLGLTVRGQLRAHLGNSMAAETAASGVNSDWWAEFSEQASGIGTTFQPTIIGFAAVLENLSNLMDFRPPSVVVTGIASVYLFVWTFLIGGVLDRLARNRKTRSNGFFAACGVFFFRFLRLGLLMLLVYWVLFSSVHTWLFGTLYPRLIRNLTVERTAFLLRFGLYGLFGAILVPVNMLFDYAKIRAVVEDRHSMVGALASASRFIRRRPWQTASLYFLNGLLFVLVLVVYALVAPGAGTIGMSMWIAFLTGQFYLIARVAVKLVFYASQTAYFQGELAHVGYTASPQPLWPESPAAEAIGNAARR